MNIPHLFKCPISLDLFKDPVTLSTGHTYDRSSIEKWLATGNLTCPVSMQKLHDPTIIPNHTLRHLIHQWLQMGSGFNPRYMEKLDSLSALKKDLESQIEEGCLQEKLRTLEKLQIQLEESPSRLCSHQLGLLSLLLNLVFGKKESQITQESLKFVELALSCVLRLLALEESEPLMTLKEESKIESFVGLLQNGTSTIKKCLCQIVEAISSSPDTKELCEKMGHNRRLLHLIILVLHNDLEASDAGIKTISALCSLESNRENLVQAGAINGLISYISNAEIREKIFAPIAVARIEQLLRHGQAKEELIKNPKGIHTLVRMVFRVSDHEGSESAVNALMIVCCDSSRAKEVAIMGGVLTQLLLLLQSQCSGRTKSKARLLLKMLRS